MSDPIKIAAANISQLTFFVAPDGSRAKTTLPDSEDVLEIMESLSVLGFNLDREVGSRSYDLWTNDDEDSPLIESIRPGSTLFFSKTGIFKLIEAGVSTTTINLLKDDCRKMRRGMP